MNPMLEERVNIAISALFPKHLDQLTCLGKRSYTYEVQPYYKAVGVSGKINVDPHAFAGLKLHATPNSAKQSKDVAIISFRKADFDPEGIMVGQIQGGHDCYVQLMFPWERTLLQKAISVARRANITLYVPTAVQITIENEVNPIYLQRLLKLYDNNARANGMTYDKTNRVYCFRPSAAPRTTITGNWAPKPAMISL